jgi:triacylglycerol lipase
LSAARFFCEAKLTRENLREARARKLPIIAAVVDKVAVSALSIQSRSGPHEIGLHIYKPKTSGATLPRIFHVHGGGYVMGAATDMAPIHRMLAAELECAIVSVDNRLAPETIFPGNIEDCSGGLAWTFESAQVERIDPSRIGVMGESAGGGLAASLALLTRDRGKYRLAFQHPIYPMLDDRTGALGEAQETHAQRHWGHLDWAIVRHLGGRLTAGQAASAKLWHSEMLWKIVDAALQLHGGAGYMNEFPIAKIWRDARVMRIYGGTSEIMREVIGRTL